MQLLCPYCKKPMKQLPFNLDDKTVKVFSRYNVMGSNVYTACHNINFDLFKKGEVFTYFRNVAETFFTQQLLKRELTKVLSEEQLEKTVVYSNIPFIRDCSCKDLSQWWGPQTCR